MLYALLNNANEILRYQEFDARPEALVAAKGLRWLPVTVDDPPFNPATHERTGPVIAVKTTEVTQTFTVTVKSPAKLAAERNARASRLETDPLLVAIIEQMAADKGVTDAAMLVLIKARVK